MKNKKISIIIPTLNQNEDLFDKCISSCLNQNYDDYEIIVVNDGGKIPIIKENPKIRLINHFKNLGISSALNTGIINSNGEYICWVSSDDEIFSNKIKKQISFIIEENHIASYHSYKINYLSGNVFNKTGSIIVETKESNNSAKTMELMREYCFINGSTVMFRKDIIYNIGKFDISLRYTQDYEFWLRILKNNINIAPLNDVLGIRNQHSSNLGNKVDDIGGSEFKIRENEIEKLKKEYNIIG